MTVDLDARRAARREKLGEAPTVTLGGDTYTLPHRLPLEAIELGAEGKVWSVIVALFGADQAEKLRPLGLDTDDLQDLFTAVYGTDMGKPSASTAS